MLVLCFGRASNYFEITFVFSQKKLGFQHQKRVSSFFFFATSEVFFASLPIFFLRLIDVIKILVGDKAWMAFRRIFTYDKFCIVLKVAVRSWTLSSNA